MLTQAAELAVGVVVLLAPGLALLLGLGVRERVLLAGLAAPVTTGLVLVVAILTGLTGIPFGIVSFGVGTALLSLLAWAARRFLSRTTTPDPVDPSVPTRTDGDPGRDQRAVLTGPALLATRLAGGLAALAGVGFGAWTWKRGLGVWSNPTQEHDTITHSVIAGYIDHTGDAAPWHMAPIDIITDRPVVYYPSGFPSLVALVSQVVGEVMTAMNLVTVAALTVAWPLGVAALAAAVVRLGGLGRGWTELAGGIAALISVFLYRPGISFAHDGGILPNAVAMVLAPGLVAAMLVLGRRRWAGGIAIGVGAAGALSVHPSVATTTVLTLLAAWAGLLLTRAGRARLSESFLPLALGGAVALLLVVPVVRGLLGLGGVGGSSNPDIDPTPLGTAFRNAVGLTYKGYFDFSGELAQMTVGVLAVAGAVAVVVFRRGWPILTAYLFWVAVSVSFQLSPGSGPGSEVAGFFYAVFTRVQAHVSLIVPVMVAVLFVLPAAALVSLRRAPATRPARPWVALGAVATGLVVLTVSQLVPYARTNSLALTERYLQPEFTRYDGDDYAAIDWLEQHVKPGEVIMNNGNDGSTLAYVEHGLPVLNVMPSGHASLPESNELLESFDTYPEDPEVRELVVEKNIRWVYYDSQAPLIGADPRSWHHSTSYAFAPGLQDLAGLPGLTPAFQAGHVTVYRLDLETVSRLP